MFTIWIFFAPYKVVLTPSHCFLMQRNLPEQCDPEPPETNLEASGMWTGTFRNLENTSNNKKTVFVSTIPFPSTLLGSNTNGWCDLSGRCRG